MSSPAPTGDSTPRPATHVRLVHWIRRRKVATATGAIVAVLIVLGCVLAIQLWREASALLGVRDAAAQISATTASPAAMTASLRTLRTQADAAEAASREPFLLGAERVPFMGDNIAAMREVSQTVAELAGSSDEIIDLLPSLSGTDQLSLAGNGRLIALADDLSARCAAGVENLDKVNDNALIGPLREQVVQARDGLRQAESGIQRLSPYLKAMTVLTSSSTQQEWLILMQNLDEARPSGGMFSSWKLVRAGQGKLVIEGQGSNGDLVSTGPVDYRSTMPKGYQDVWGDSLSDWRSMNLSANFPDNARLVTKAWNDRHSRKIEGVLTLGQGSVQYLAGATGALTVGGRTIDPAAMTEYLTVGIYRDYPDPAKVDAVVAQLSSEVFQRLSRGQIDLKSLVKAAVAAGNSDQLQLWSARPDTQRQIVAAGLSGAFGQEEGPVASVRLANGGGNKLDAFLHLDVQYQLGACKTDADDLSTRSSTLKVTVTNSAPTSGLPRYMTARADSSETGGAKNAPVGSNRDFVVIYAPLDSVVTGSTQDGADATGQDAMIGERPMLVFTADLKPGQSTTLTVTWDEQAIGRNDQPLPTSPKVILPPLINTPAVKLVAAAPCR